MQMQIHYSLNTHDFSYGTNWSWNADAFDFAPDPNYPTQKIDYKPYGYKVLVGDDPLDFYTNAEAKKYYKQRIRYILSRWGYSPNIAFFELISEISNTGCKIPECNPDDGEGGGRYDENTIPTYKNWQIEMATYIKSFYYGKKHPLGSGYTSALTDFVNTDDTYKNQNFDLICYTRYNYGIPRFGQEILDMTKEITLLTKNNIKPVIFSEGDMQDAICDLNVVEMRRFLWQSMFSGAAGLFSWNMDDHPQLYPILGQMRNVLNEFNLNFENDKWHPGSCKLENDDKTWTFMDGNGHFLQRNFIKNMDGKNKKADFIYLRSGDRNLGIGVTTNKTYNIYNLSECYQLNIDSIQENIGNTEILVKAKTEDIKFRNMILLGNYNTYYYPVSVPNISYAYKMDVGSKFKIIAKIDANLNRYITLVATHRGQGFSINEKTTEDKRMEEGFAEISNPLNQNDTSIVIYPNPFLDKISINNPFNEVITLEWMTIDGKFIQSNKIVTGKHNINTVGINKGFYLIRVLKGNDTIFTSKFLKL